ncbi:MAG: tyrosine-type recombinase/integrase, partial [Janthinobacterium lividum]
NRHGQVSAKGLTPQTVALVVKHYAEAAGFDPDEFAGHSLRAGFLTSAAEAGADVLRMMEVSRHKRVETVRSYVRRANLFRGHAGAAFL